MAVFCRRCPYLLVVKGVAPLCLAKAAPVRGPLREAIDVKGTAFAMRRNRTNRCRLFRSRWSIAAMWDAWKKRRLVLRFLGPVEVLPLSYYPEVLERPRVQQRIEKVKTEATEVEAYGESDAEGERDDEALDEEISGEKEVADEAGQEESGESAGGGDDTYLDRLTEREVEELSTFVGKRESSSDSS